MRPQARGTDRIIFEDKKFVEKCWTHDLEALVELLGLTQEVASVRAAPPTRPEVATRWSIVKSWSEKSRYVRTSEQKARELVAAITDPAHGVLSWIKGYW